MDVLLSRIKEPEYLVRSAFDDVKFEDLKKSIKATGLIHPITVRREGKNYELISGHRRLEAHKQLGLEKIKVLVTKAKGLDAERIKIAENADRDDVNAVDQGEYFWALMDKYGMNQKQLAEIVGRSEGYISQRVHTQDWTGDIKEAVQDESITFSTGRALMAVTDIKDRMFYFEKVIQNGASPHVVMEWARQSNEALARAEAEYTQPETTQNDQTSYDWKVKCDCCGRTDPGDESSSISVCAYCKATTESEDFQIYMLQCRQVWLDAAAKRIQDAADLDAAEKITEGATP